MSAARKHLAATSIGNYVIFAGGTSSGYSATVDAYQVNDGLEISVYKGSKYKFQNMVEEETVTADMATISIPTPATGYIKFKNTTIS